MRLLLVYSRPTLTSYARQDQLRQFLEKERPIWPISSFAPAAHDPILLDVGDISPEEMRVHAYKLIGEGKLEEYVRAHACCI